MKILVLFSGISILFAFQLSQLINIFNVTFQIFEINCLLANYICICFQLEASLDSITLTRENICRGSDTMIFEQRSTLNQIVLPTLI